MKCYSILLAVAVIACQNKPQTADTRGLVSDSAMVVCAHPLAAQVGMDILKKGGNAIDAVIAVQFALIVAFPEAGNLGGGGFMLVRTKDGVTNALDYREKAPAKAATDMYLDKKGEVVPGLSTVGHLASGVPGSVDGMIEAHKKYGSLPWSDLVQPAIDMALGGIPLTERAAKNLNGLQVDLKKHNSVAPEF